MASCSGAGGGGPGTKYTYAQLEGLWINAGGPKLVAPVAAAIALAESGGCSSDLNPTDNGGTQTSVGLWQVSNGTHQYPAAWMSAAGNAAEAVAKYTGAGNSFKPWGTYNSGAYTAYLNGSTTPDLSVPGSASTTAASSTTYNAEGCLLGFPGISIPVVGSTGSFCLLSKSEARGIIGGACLVAGGLVAVAGVLILAAAGLGKSGGLQKAADAAAVVPMGGAVAEGLTVAHRRSTRTGGQVTGQRRASA